MIDFRTKKGFICDMDGVIYHGNQVLPGVVEFIDWLHKENKEFLFLTNNSGSTPRELQQKLARMGLDVSEEHFYTSALATAAFLKEQAPGCSVYAIGEAGLLNALYDAGITMNDVNPDYVVIGEGKSYSLDTLTKATNLVLKGAKLIGANSDLTGPIENGIAPACRALIAPITCNRKAGILLWEAESFNDAYRTKYSGMSFRRSGDGWRSNGYRCNFRHGMWYVHRFGSVGCFQ